MKQCKAVEFKQFYYIYFKKKKNKTFKTRGLADGEKDEKYRIFPIAMLIVCAQEKKETSVRERSSVQ